MVRLNQEEIWKILLGATFMASGGGGPVEVSKTMLAEFKNSTVDLYEIDELEADKYAVNIAAMGAPSEAANRDFDAILKNTFQYIKQKALDLETPKDILYCMPAEYGGFNTFAPIYLALVDRSVKLIDVEGSGRAVPGLDTALISLNQCPIIPFVMANENNDCIEISLNNKNNASACESVCRGICSSSVYNSISGVAGWMMNKSELETYALTGSLTRAKTIGNLINKYKANNKDNIFDYLTNNASDIIKTKALAHNKNGNTSILRDISMKKINGFDVGEILIHSNECVWKIYFINESLVIYKNDIPYMTAPDVICIFDDNNCMPLSNDYILEHKDTLKDKSVSVGVIQVNEKWWQNRNNEQMSSIWRPYFNAVGYNGDCIQYS